MTERELADVQHQLSNLKMKGNIKTDCSVKPPWATNYTTYSFQNTTSSKSYGLHYYENNMK